VARAYALAFGRDADEEEVKAAVGFVGAHGLKDFCRALLNMNELIYLE